MNIQKFAIANEATKRMCEFTVLKFIFPIDSILNSTGLSGLSIVAILNLLNF